MGWLKVEQRIKEEKRRRTSHARDQSNARRPAKGEPQWTRAPARLLPTEQG